MQVWCASSAVVSGTSAVHDLGSSSEQLTGAYLSVTAVMIHVDVDVVEVGLLGIWTRSSKDTNA